MKKKTIKKFTAVVMAAVMAVGMMNMGVQANAERVSAAVNDDADEIMPLYDKMGIVSWTDCETKQYCKGTYIVQSTPVKAVYCNCLKGAAEVTIEVNDIDEVIFTIPKTAYIEQMIQIPCNKGDEIRVKVKPAKGYAVTTGDFMLYY